jgi:UDP-N-acetylmuramate dehydrogenase
MSAARDALEVLRGRGALQEDAPLAPYTTLGLGGAARYLVTAQDEPTLRDALSWAQRESMQVALLGGGSNIVAKDEGFDGLVIALRTRGIERARAAGGVVHVTAAAGESWDDFVASCVADDLAGLECLSGIPGLVGATPIQNVGAYGQEVSGTIASVRVLDRASLQVKVLDASECRFAYRDSALKRTPERYAVLAVTFALAKGGAPIVRYKELSDSLAMLAGKGKAPSLKLVRETVIGLRRSKSMVLDPSDENGRSAGSFFLNPIVRTRVVDALAAQLVDEGVIKEAAALPRFSAGAGFTKLPAAWLIERAGFQKGERRGAVSISTKHSLSLVCHEGATSEALLGFASEIGERVTQRFGIELVREPVVLG